MTAIAPFKTISLSEMRASKKVTQDYLAKMLNIHRTTLNRYEKGKLPVPKSILCMAALVLGYQPGQIKGYME